MKESIKFQLDLAKSLILALLTATFGIFGYCVINYEKIEIWQFFAAGMGLVLIFVSLFFDSKKYAF